MIVPIQRREHTAEENVLPLINIVFLLLIFFMMAGALSVTTPFPVEPPASRAAEATEAPREGVAIGADGRVALDGEEVTLEELGERLRGRPREERGQRILAVHADREGRSERLLEVIEVVREAGVERIRLLSIGNDADAA